VLAVALRRDGQRLALGCANGTIHTGNPTGDGPLTEWKAHTDEVRGLAFLRDGQTLVSAGGEGTLKWWDPDTGNEKRSVVAHPGGLTCLALSPNGWHVATGGKDGLGKIWEQTGKEKAVPAWPHQDAVTGVVFSPDSKWLATVGGGSQHRWDVATGGFRASFSSSAPFSAVAYSPEGQTLAIGLISSPVYLVPATGGLPTIRNPRPNGGAVNALAYSPDGKNLVVGYADGYLCLCRAPDFQKTVSLPSHQGEIKALAFDGTGSVLVVGGSDGQAAVWQFPKPDVVAAKPDPMAEGHTQALLKRVEAARQDGRIAKTRKMGSGRDPYEDVPMPAGLLVGFSFGYGKFGANTTLGTVRPLFLTAKGKVEGERHGVKERSDFRIEAPPGYAVGAVTIKALAGVDGMSLTFMAIKENGLDPNQAIESDWIGGQGGGPKTTIGGTGAPVIGIFGATAVPPGSPFNGLGLVTATVEGNPVGVNPDPLPVKPPEVPGNMVPVAYTNSLGMAFALVPRGESWLGGGAGKLRTKEVEIRQDFYLGVYEVTQEEWEKVTGKNPSRFKGGAGVSKDDQKRFPVEEVSWEDAQAFVKLVNEQMKEVGWEYRLPTEEEWEYACRGGPMADKADSAFDFYLEKPTNQLPPEKANTSDSGLKRPCKVGSYAPNRLGLYDMHGNVSEWCLDEVPAAAGASQRVSRGGSWVFPSVICRAAGRYVESPAYRHRSHGMRLARVPSAAK